MRIRQIAALAAVFALAGCAHPTTRPERVAVTSKVTFANGQPVKDVMCCFLPHSALQMPGEFPLDANGNLTKTANGVEPKLLPGKYTVYFAPIERPTGAKFAAAIKLVPERYKQQGGTGLDIEVASAGGEVAIKLES